MLHIQNTQQSISRNGDTFDGAVATKMWRQIVDELYSQSRRFIGDHKKKVYLTPESWEGNPNNFAKLVGQIDELQKWAGYIDKLYIDFNKVNGKNYEFVHTFNMTCEVILAMEMDPRYSFDIKSVQEDERLLLPKCTKISPARDC